MSDEENLRKIGLNKYEAKAYLCILNHGIIDAKTICQKENIPTGKIYETISSLKNKNFIEVQNTRPKKYRAVKPSIAFEKFYSEKKKQMETDLAKSKETMDMIGEVLSRKNKNVYEEKEFWKVAFKKDILKMMMDCINNAEKETNFLINEPLDNTNMKDFLYDLPLLISKLKQLSKKGVKIRILKEKSGKRPLKDLFKKTEIDKNLLNSVRVLEKKTPDLFMIFDNETILIRVANPLIENDFLAMIKIWNPMLAKDLNERFIKLWEMSKPFRIE